MSQQAIYLDNVLNFRDVGSTVNEFLAERRLREGVFYRSARLDEASAEDISTIRSTIGLNTVIDLRTKTEHREQARKHREGLGSRSLDNGRIPDIAYHDVKITGRAFERHILSRLSWWSFIKLIVLYVLGFRKQAVSILGREVMAPRGLLGLGIDTIDFSGTEIRDILLLYTDSHSLPSLVHCTQGKDRTGLICALVLMILEIPVEAIEHDYFLTDVALKESQAERMAEIRTIGLPDHWAGTASNMISGIHSHLTDKYGGLDAYLDSIGFPEQERTKVKTNLLY